MSTQGKMEKVFRFYQGFNQGMGVWTGIVREEGLAGGEGWRGGPTTASSLGRTLRGVLASLVGKRIAEVVEVLDGGVVQGEEGLEEWWEEGIALEGSEEEL